MAILSVIIPVMNVRNQSGQAKAKALVHFVTALANLFTDQRMSGLPIRAKYKHFKTILKHTFDNSPTD